MNYTHSLLLLFSLAPYSIHGMYTPWLADSSMYFPLELDVKRCEQNNDHFNAALKPYLKGKEKTVAKDIIEQLKGRNNLDPFVNWMHRFNRKDNANFSPLTSLMPILFDLEAHKGKRDDIYLRVFRRNPEMFNKAIFGLKILSPKSEDIRLYSEEIQKSWYVHPSEKDNLDCLDEDWFVVNQQFFYCMLSPRKYLESMRPMTKEEKERYWQESLRLQFHPEFYNQGAVARYRAQVISILIMNKRLKKIKGVGIEKRVLYPQIIVPLFEQEFTDFKNHCNTVEQELSREIALTNIKDPEQKPFFDNFPQWYAEKKKECFEGLDFETVKKILSYKFGR